jgi:hypothetical protein
MKGSGLARRALGLQYARPESICAGFKAKFEQIWNAKMRSTGDRDALIFGGVFLVACAILVAGMIEPGWFIRAPRPPRMESNAANLAWGVAARRYQHEQRLCADVDELDKASHDLEEEKTWSDDPKSAAAQADLDFDADMERHKRLLDCLAKIAPLPSPPRP